MKSGDFYQRHLDAVSRSFALCIPQLDQPFRERVALSYLLLRVLDTVEDAPFSDKERQELQFETFRSFLRTRPSSAQVDAFVKAFPSGITQGERALLADSYAFFEDAHALPEEAKSAMFSAIDRMAEGMAAYARRPQPLRLVDLEDVTRYCCIVAGLVGELLTNLWAIGKSSAPALVLAYRFGVYLQKVNILKDQEEDEEAGRFLVPDRRELLGSLRADAEGALAYLRSLPREERGYRVFCAWSLMLGAASLGQLDHPKQSHRAQTAKLLARTAAIAQDDEALARLFSELLPPLPEIKPRAPLRKPESAEEFRGIVATPLTDAEWLEVGIAVEPHKRAASQ
ncbi:MAG TPA: squalene/phytoene synthase family protein [Myxococcales bacterium]